MFHRSYFLRNGALLLGVALFNGTTAQNTDSLTAEEADLRKQLEAEKRSSTTRRTVLRGGGIVVPIIGIAVPMRRRRARRQQG